MSVLNEDTIWLVDSDGLTGGVYRTTNGGVSWQQQAAPPSDHIYMFNARIGFIHGGGGIYKTTNSGNSWNLIKSNDLFLDMQFIDSLTGWKCEGASDSIHFTSNGGLNWIKQTIPLHGVSGGNCLFYSRMTNISVINKDTIMGVGGVFSCTGYNYRGIIYRTTNGGNNWLYQLPDTHYVTCPVYSHITFINKNIGWVYGSNTGAHTVTGGDTTWLTSVQKTNNNIPTEFKLYQNYPNPFNPGTVIRYEIRSQRSEVRMIIYDITGREISTLVNEVQNTGTYEVDFSGTGYSSGVYFYKLIITAGKEVFTETKKMLMLK